MNPRSLMHFQAEQSQERSQDKEMIICMSIRILPPTFFHADADSFTFFFYLEQPHQSNNSNENQKRKRAHISYSKKTFGNDNHIFNLINNDNFSAAIKIQTEVISHFFGMMMNGKRIQLKKKSTISRNIQRFFLLFKYIVPVLLMLG